MTARRDPREVFVERVPRHAFATDDLRYGLRMRPGTEALQKRLLQFNARHSLSWLTFDVDTDTALFDWQDRDCPAPNIIARNPSNGHAHYFYGLEAAVHAYHNASQKAQRYLASIDVALTAKLGADPGFSKLIGKNPTHAAWEVHTPRFDLYDLAELADWLDLATYGDGRRRLPTHGLGRNCTLFENLRHWAYRARRHAWLSEGLFADAVLGHALELNQTFTPPLPHSEVRATARSVSGWTWDRMSPLGFSRIQQIRGKKGGAVRRAQAAELTTAILDTIQKNPGLSQADVAAILGIARETVSRRVTKALSDKGSLPVPERLPSVRVGGLALDDPTHPGRLTSTNKSNNRAQAQNSKGGHP